MESYYLCYSVCGEQMWRRFQTGATIWTAKYGHALRDTFYVFQEARATALEWMGNGQNHYPLAIFRGDEPNVPCTIYEMEPWPYLRDRYRWQARINTLPLTEPAALVVV